MWNAVASEARHLFSIQMVVIARRTRRTTEDLK
jgi:hypothetical protein